MADDGQVQKLKQGVKAWNAWRDGNPEQKIDLSGASFREAILIDADLDRADLDRADLSEAILNRANLSGADLSKAILDRAEFNEAILSEANLSKAILSRAQLLAANLGAANLRAANLSGANLFRANLSDADLSDAYLSEAELSEAILSKANLSRADLDRADLDRAELSEATLSKANLNRANLSDANLSDADLSDAYLTDAILNRADLSGADLEGAHLLEAVFADVNLSQAKHLDLCIHMGPSVIDHRTLAKSGELPFSFLRGCGLPDDLIEYLPSLRQWPLQFYSCFISYSHKDQEFAERLHADLQSKGVRCWFAPHDVKGGRKLHEQIGEAVRIFDRLLLVLSEHSMASEWVKTEIEEARKREAREERQVLFPVRLVDFEVIREWKCFDADIGRDSAKEVREYFIPDFSNWKDHDEYQKAFERLLRDLRAEKRSTDE